MKRLVALAVLAFTAVPYTAHAQQPYAGFEARTIKALSDQQLADLRAGRGMGLALAAELNGYPINGVTIHEVVWMDEDEFDEDDF